MKINFCLFLLISFCSYTQEKSDFKIEFSGFLEAYYAYDFNEPQSEGKLPFMYNYNRHNEFNLNIGVLRSKLEYENAYASFALHSGTYVDDNYANEKLKYVSEAYVGLHLDSSKKNSIEVGILPSYIGFESATTSNNLTLTRSVLAENSPYFMTGVKYNYTPSDQWNFAILITNGWQRINKPDKNIPPSFGSQVVYKSNLNSTFNWSTFVGKEFNGFDFTMRYFSNVYFDKKWSDKWRTIVGFDYGVQDTSSQNDVHESWFSPVLIVQRSLATKWQTAVRLEYYSDNNNIIVTAEDEFKLLGVSLNVDYIANSKVKLRTEARYFETTKDLFYNPSELVSTSLFVTTSLSFEF